MVASGEHAGLERGHEPGLDDGRLAASRRADDPNEWRAGQPRDEIGDEPLAAEEVLGVGRGEGGEALERADDNALVRHGRARRSRVVLERRVLAEDRPLELLQRAARLQTELLAQQLSRAAVGGERIGLATRPVEGQHQLATQPLLQRVDCDEGFELGDQVGDVTDREVCLDPVLHRGEPELLQASDLVLRELEQAQVGQGGPAPERERLAQRRGGADRISGGERVATPLEQTLEHRDVELIRSCVEDVASGARLDRPIAAERPSQARDRRLHGVGGRGRRLLPEELVERSLARHVLVGVYE